MARTTTAASLIEILHAANSAASAYPPLQAALGLVKYIETSIDQFKSNRNEIKSIGEYAQRLSLQLERSVDLTKTKDYVQVIEGIHAYLKGVAKQKKLLQYLHRNDIAERLQEYRTQLREEFVVFSITCDLDIQESQREAEAARQRDESEARVLLETISHNIATSPTGIRELNTEIGDLKDRSMGNLMLQELESLRTSPTPEDSSIESESTIVGESITLTKLILSTNYRWFPETFNARHYARSQIQEALIDTIRDVAGDLRDSGLLAHRTKAELASARTGLEQVDIVFRVLDSRPRDAVLLRTFQKALFRAGGMTESDMLNPKLAKAEGFV
ncbi:hypothetical protein MIND_00796400 [Mycena indigotica]|uniref:Uncharacterized protein n=1 Tax=Mycena indigotica TaxID=2126181 RepID=A0A8H6SQV7_9AGAR|nr:uncharacterized protein MIND_00796400 [Mycena indigotica]KAF7302290.1 hypothetical protein MIND_00796400 [Mycena indigotica]